MVFDAKFTLNETAISGGFAEDDDFFNRSGGGIHGVQAEINISNSIITGNTGLRGAGVLVRNEYGNASLTITNSTISDNSGTGLVIYVNDFSNSVVANIDNSIISGNTSDIEGGCRLIAPGELDSSNSTIINNTIIDNVSMKSGRGIAIYSYGYTLLE